MMKIYVQPDKVILTDCDGVLLDWEYAFDTWMHRHGYTIKESGHYAVTIKYSITNQESKKLIMMFNESAWIRRLGPLRDAIKYVRKLHEEHGYVFHCISSLTDDEYSQHLRTKNIQELFGESAFARYVYLDCGADKDKHLKEYKDSNCWWLEDKAENAIVGDSLGLNAIIMGHNHNADYTGNIPRVQDWREVYRLITGE